MERHPYEPFVDWAQQYCTKNFYHNPAAFRSAQAWLVSFGVVAARIHRYLELGHEGAHTLPNSLVLDILELAQSPHADFPDRDPRRALIDTWIGLVQVYGTACAPGDQQLHRLELLTDWAEVLETPPGPDFPGRSIMVSRFAHEFGRLDLTQLRKEEHNFKYVGMCVELLKLYRPLLPSQAFPARGNQMVPASRLRRPQMSPTFVGREAGSRDVTRTRKPSNESRNGRQISSGHALFGNWSDHWRNTLPGRN